MTKMIWFGRKEVERINEEEKNMERTKMRKKENVQRRVDLVKKARGRER